MTDISSLRLEKNDLNCFGVITMLPPRPVNEGRITRERAMVGSSKAHWLILTERISLDMLQASQKRFVARFGWALEALFRL